MMNFLRGVKRKSMAIVGVSLIVFAIIHQLSFIGDVAFTNNLSESLEVIQECSSTPLQQTRHFRWTVDSNIPNIVHQIWKNADLRTYSMEASHQSWKAMFEPMNYTVKLWTDGDVLQLIQAEYSWLLSTYESYPQDIQRADVARLVVVHAEGGMYADLDVHPRSVEGMSCLQHLGLQGIFVPTAGAKGLSNHFFMAERGSDFLKWILQEAKRRGGPTSKRILLSYLQVFWSTGPIMVTSAFREYARVYSGGDHRLGALNEGYRRLVIGHAAGRSWHKLDGYLLNYFADHVALGSFWAVVLSFGVVFVLACVLFRRRGRLMS